MPPDRSPTSWPESPTRLALPVEPSMGSLTCSAAQPQDGPCPVCPHLAERFEPFRRAAYWEAMHHKAKLRIAELEQRNAELEAKLRLREQQLFGKKSEAGAARSEALTAPEATPKKPRGQQPGKPGPQRRDRSHLPFVQEVLDLPKDQQCCPCCGLPFEPFTG